MILVIDNYDSFTWNLVQYIGEISEMPRVVRNDEITADEVARLKPEAIVLSPGPGRPADAGVCIDVVRRHSGTTPILGVCLGHQCIGEAFGGSIVRADRLVHGKTSAVIHTGSGIFQDVGNPFDATRYHSLLVARKGLPDTLEVIAWTAEDEIMGLRHREHETWAVQFHPESILTVQGKDLLRNFLRLAAGGSKPAGAPAAR